MDVDRSALFQKAERSICCRFLFVKHKNKQIFSKNDTIITDMVNSIINVIASLESASTSINKETLKEDFKKNCDIQKVKKHLLNIDLSDYSRHVLKKPKNTDFTNHRRDLEKLCDKYGDNVTKIICRSINIFRDKLHVYNEQIEAQSSNLNDAKFVSPSSKSIPKKGVLKPITNTASSDKNRGCNKKERSDLKVRMATDTLSVKDAIVKLASSLKTATSYKHFCRENNDKVAGLFKSLKNYEHEHNSQISHLNVLCSGIITECPDQQFMTVPKLKRFFRSANKFAAKKGMLKKLRAAIRKAESELEPGEEAPNLWSDEIESHFNDIMDLDVDLETMSMPSLEKNLMNMLKGMSLWHKGNMEVSFLKSKADEYFRSTYLEDVEENQEQDEPRNTRSIPVLPSKGPSVPTNGAAPTIDLPKFVPSTSPNIPQKSRHRSDESLCSVNLDSHSNRKRHASNESQRNRPKKRSRKSLARPSAYDKALAGFQVWEPLKSQWGATTKHKKQVFETKADEEDILNTVPVITTPNQDLIDLSDTTKDKFKLLTDRFGLIKIIEKTVLQGSTYTLVISVQGYQFEGVSGSHDGAIQDASAKALLLSPYLFTSLQ